MTALLHRFLHDRLLHDQLQNDRLLRTPSHARRVQLTSRVLASPVPSPRDAMLAPAGERLATRNELDALRSLHPRRVAAGR